MYIIDKIEIQTRIISMNPARGFCIPKNKTLQMAFRKKFIPNTQTILVLSFFFLAFNQTKVREMAIRRNKMFQTIGKTKFGGVIEGLMESYQEVFTFDDVKILPINPVPNVTTRETKKTFHQLPLFMVLFRF